MDVLFTSMLITSIIITDVQMNVQLLRGIIMYKRKKNQPLHQQTQLLFAAIPFGSGDKIQEACPFWTYKRFGVSNHSNDL